MSNVNPTVEEREKKKVRQVQQYKLCCASRVRKSEETKIKEKDN